MIPQVQVGAQPRGGPGSERARGSSTHACTHTHTRVCLHTRRVPARDPAGTSVHRRGPKRNGEPLGPCPGRRSCAGSPAPLGPQEAGTAGRLLPAPLARGSPHDPRKGHVPHHSFAPREQGPLCVCSSITELGLGTAAPPARADGWSGAGGTALGPSCTTLGIRPTLWTPQRGPPEQVPWERLCPSVPQAACRRSGEGAGIGSPELAARARRGRRKPAPADRAARTRQRRCAAGMQWQTLWHSAFPCLRAERWTPLEPGPPQHGQKGPGKML